MGQALGQGWYGEDPSRGLGMPVPALAALDFESIGRALALQACRADPDFRNYPVGIRDSSTKPEYYFRRIHGVRVR